MTAAQSYVEHLEAQLAERVFGVGDVVRRLAMCRIANGHALLEGPPGVGKTLLAKSFADAIGGSFRRIQGTPDLLPSDITGVTLFRPDGSEFEFRPGPLFADVVLVDEINRAGPKTQAALLEAMEERRVTLDGNSRPLPDAFLVIATQNPLEFEGTYPLPESQIDRFLVRIDLDYVDRAAEAQVLKRYAEPEGMQLPPLAALPDESARLAAARAAVLATEVKPALIDYVLDICLATRSATDLSLGLSTRAARALLLLSRVHAAVAGASFVRPDDVQAVVGAVAAHRLVLAPEAMLSGLTRGDRLQQLVRSVPVPRVEGSVPAVDAAGAPDLSPDRE